MERKGVLEDSEGEAGGLESGAKNDLDITGRMQRSRANGAIRPLPAAIEPGTMSVPLIIIIVVVGGGGGSSSDDAIR